eukprot:scaffold13386_cov214-Isochrysis_galbana.AAC.1
MGKESDQEEEAAKACGGDRMRLSSLALGDGYPQRLEPRCELQRVVGRQLHLLGWPHGSHLLRFDPGPIRVQDDAEGAHVGLPDPLHVCAQVQLQLRSLIGLRLVQSEGVATEHAPSSLVLMAQHAGARRNPASAKATSGFTPPGALTGACGCPCGVCARSPPLDGAGRPAGAIVQRARPA